MPYFVIIGHDVPNSKDARAQARDAHVARLKVLEEDGRLLVAGPTPNPDDANQMTGSVVIAEFDDADALSSWLEEEPYLLQNVYHRVDVLPYIPVLGRNRGNA